MLFRKKLSKRLKDALDDFIRRNYASPKEALICEDHAVSREASPTQPMAKRASVERAAKAPTPLYAAGMRAVPTETAAMPTTAPDLEARLGMLDESFQEMLLRKIDEKGMKDSECYKRAGIDRKLFSKIRSNPQYRPKKSTAIAFCFALELSYDEAEEMLRKAGYALSRSSKSDVIVEYFLCNRRYSLHELNCALYEYDQQVI